MQLMPEQTFGFLSAPPPCCLGAYADAYAGDEEE